MPAAFTLRQVVVVAVNPAGGQPLRLPVVEDAGGDGNVETGLVSHHRHELEDAVEGPLVGTPHGEHDAELGSAESRRLPGRADDFVRVEEGGRFHRRVETRRLRTEMTILRATACLGRQDALHFDAVPAPGESDLVGEGGQARDSVVRHFGQLGQLTWSEQAPVVDEGHRSGSDGGPDFGELHVPKLIPTQRGRKLCRRLRGA
jgi:hypothetical protein